MIIFFVKKKMSNILFLFLKLFLKKIIKTIFKSKLSYLYTALNKTISFMYVLFGELGIKRTIIT